MNDKLISVIMCIYNEKNEELCLAIESILGQTYKNFEFLILVEFDTKHELIEIVENYKCQDSRIRVLYNQQRLGFPETLNIGIKSAKGEYIARMDADDISSINRIKIQKEYLDSNTDVSLVSGNMVFINENNEIIRKNFNYTNIDNYINKLMMHGNVVVHPCVMYRKDDILELGGYRNLDTAEDYDLWLRLLLNKKRIHVINMVLLKYRIRSESASNRKSVKLRLTTKILRKNFKIGKITSENDIDKLINRYSNKFDKILYSYNIYDSSWEKKKEKNFLVFLIYFSYAIFLNLDLVLVTYDSLVFNYYIKKSNQ